MRGLTSRRVLVFLVLPLLIQAGVLVPEFAVTEGMGDFYSYKVELCVDCSPSGEFVIAWIDTRLGGEYFGGFKPDEFHQIYSQYVNSQGVLEGGNNRMNTGENFVIFPRQFEVVMFDDGKVLTATAPHDKGSQYSGLAIVRLWASGKSMTENPIFEYEIGLKDPIYLACNSEDVYVAVQGIGDELYFQFYTREGELVVDSGTIDSACAKDVIMDDAGNFVIIFQDDNRDYNYQRFNPSGELVGDRVGIEYRSVIAGEASGELMCSWNDDGVVYCRMYSSSDVPGEIYQVGFGGGAALQPGPGGFLVTWTSVDTLYGRLVSTSGIPNGDVLVINNPAGKNTGYPVIASDDERYRVAWTERENSAIFQSWVYTRMVYPSGLVSASVPRVCDDEPGAHSVWNEAVLMPEGDFCNIQHGYFNRDANTGVSILYLDNEGRISNQGLALEDVTASRLTQGSDGYLYLSYVTADDDYSRLWVQRLSQCGDPVGPPFEMHKYNEGKGITTTVTEVDEDGDGVVVWVKGTLYVQLFAQRFTRSGSRLGEPILVADTFHTRRGLNAYTFDDGSFIIGHCFDMAKIEYWYFLYNDQGKLIQMPKRVDNPFSTTQGCYSMACNGVDRFVVTWVSASLDSFFFRVHDHYGNHIGEPQVIVPPDFGETASLKWGGYYPNASMAPDGKFVIYWQAQDDAGNLNLWAQCFSRDGEALCSPFQVNDPDPWVGCHQISGWRGVSAQNDRILFTWLDNRYHRGWDIMAKVTDWNVGGPAIEDNFSELNTIRLTTSLNQLSYDVPGEAVLSLYSVDGRLVEHLVVENQGVIEFNHLPSGVYFARVRMGEENESAKLLVIK